MTLDIAALRALAEKATSGPWRWGDWSARFGTVESDEHMLTLEHNLTRGADPTPYKCTRADGRHRVLTVEASDSFGSNGDNDKAFIAAARTALPEALTEIERLRCSLSLHETRERQATEACAALTIENQRLRDRMKRAESESPFAIVDGEIVGPNLRFEAAALVEPERQRDPTDGKAIILDAIVEMLNGAYRSAASTEGARFRDALNLAIDIADMAVTISTSTDEWKTEKRARLSALRAVAGGK